MQEQVIIVNYLLLCYNPFIGGLVPIIEPEVDIHSEQKELCKKILKDEIIRKLKEWNPADKIMFKFTIPTVANQYLDLYD